MIKGVIFDMDGVIIDSEPMHYKVFMQYSKEVLGLEIATEEYNTFIGTTNTHIFTSLKEKYHLKQAVNELVEDYEQKIEKFLLASKGTVAPIEGVDVLAGKLYKENLKLAVASSSAKRRIEIVVDMFNMAEYFAAKISGEEIRHSKPAPDIFLLTAKTLGLLPSECVVIEDSTNGVAAAKAAGMKCIGYNNPSSVNQDISRADRIINGFNELNKQIELISKL
ncbi:MAG: HAD family phosphatase [Pelosinus sp.]|nr:HAD family phosphatase [Pelosinus sp.]